MRPLFSFFLSTSKKETRTKETRCTEGDPGGLPSQASIDALFEIFHRKLFN